MQDDVIEENGNNNPPDGEVQGLYFDRIYFMRDTGYEYSSNRFVKRIELGHLDDEDTGNRLMIILGNFFTYLQELGFEAEDVVSATDTLFEAAFAGLEEDEEGAGSENSEEEFQMFLNFITNCKDERFFRHIHNLYTEDIKKGNNN